MAIDIRDYANSSKKIPTQFLIPQKSVSSITFKSLVASFALDGLLVLTTANVFAAIFNYSFRDFMMSSGLAKNFHNIQFQSLSLALCPLIMMSYYFFSYFFNDGQTYGMNKHKIRVEMPHMNFRSSALWAAYSATTLVSLGVFSLFYKKWESFKEHDHLYSILMTEKIASPVNLFDIIQSQEVQGIEETEVFLRAAQIFFLI